MTRIQLACFFLLASAFVLGGLLLTRTQTLTSQAEAGLVISQQGLTVMTAQTRDGEEALFVIDDASQMLLIYIVDIARERIELSHVENLRPMLQAPARGGR